jgi:catechol 2,3-dioxygenase-like lactoylglutathione lyase family enzyme
VRVESRSGIVGLDHVQLAMPAGEETAAAAFYGTLLGLEQMPKPEALAGRGGCWFERGGVRVHLGVDAGFRPAQKAHPGLVASGIDDLAATLEAAGHPVRWDDDGSGRRHFYVDDPFGNRIEIIAE